MESAIDTGSKFRNVLGGVRFFDALNGFAAGADGVLATSDGGRTWAWSKVHGGEFYWKNEHHQLASISVCTDASWMVFRDGSVFRTTDKARNWHPSHGQGLLWTEDDTTVDVNVFFEANGKCGVILGADGRLYRTRDSGIRWTVDPDSHDFFHLACTGNRCLLADTDRVLYQIAVCGQ